MTVDEPRPRRNSMALPEEANGLERAVCNALAKSRDLLCEALSDPDLDPDERAEYEADLRQTGENFRALQQTVYRRIV